jgi:HK97 gp10 family phage protein
MNAKWQFSRKPRKVFYDLKKETQRRIIARAIKPAATEIRDDLRSSTPRDSGALQTSISLKIAGKGKKTVAVVGPRSKYSKTRKRVVKKPSRYAGLVDKGTRFFPGRHFYERVWNSRQAAYIATVQENLAIEIERQLSK